MDAFSGPKPGSDCTASSSSPPLEASAQTFSARPSNWSTSTRQTWWTRLPIDPGNRWIAGVGAQSATKSSSDMAAMAATSKVPPIRSAMTAGPLNAFSIGTC